MDPRFARLDTLFQAARRLPREQRAEAIERGCGGDKALRAEVESLLDALESAPDAEPALSVAGLVAEAWPTDAPPESFCGFRIVRRLASGGMGVVYEAEQAHPRRRVALKVLHPNAASDEGRRRFDREAEILARLHHPGIAQVHVFGTAPTPTGDSPFIAMELVDGAPLNVHARALDARGKLELLARVCDAVAHAHANGVIHRDLKPSNILVTHAGEVKVLDFGVARLVDADTALRTRTGQIIGTLAYMSPEQATGDLDRVDTRSDVYSLGVLGYEMLCGRLPHEIGSGALADGIRRIVEEEPPEPSSFDRNLRGDISLILRKALAKEPARRYEGAAAIAEDIRRHLADEPIVARAPTATYQIRRFVRRHKALVGGVAATIGALLVGLVVAVRSAREEERQRIRADRSAAEARMAASRTLIEAAASDVRALAGPSARRRLDRVPPEDRDWAWRLLSSQVDASLRSIALEGTRDGLFVLDGRTEAVGYFDARGPVLADARTGARATSDYPALAWRRLCRLGSGLVALGAEKQVGWTRLESGRTTLAQVQGTVTAIAGTADGSAIAVCIHGNLGYSTIHILDAASGEPRSIVRGDVVEMTALAFSPDGERLVGAGFHMDLHVWDVSSGAKLHTLRGHTGGTRALEWSSDGRSLLSGSDDKTVVVWRMEDGAILRRWPDHEGEVGAVAWSTDGAHAASGDALGTIRTWNVATGACERVLQGHGGRVAALAFRDERTLVSAGQDGIREWDVTAGRDPDVLRYHRSQAAGNPFPYVYAVAFSPDGSLLASGAWDDTVRLVDPATGELLATLGPVEPHIYDLVFHADGRRVLGGSSGCRVWDADTGALLVLGERAGAATDEGYAVSPDGRLAAAASLRALRIFDLGTLDDVAAWGERRLVLDCAWSPDGSLVATVGNDGKCLLRAMPGGELVRTIDAHAREGLAVAFDASGARVATGGADRAVRVWETRTGRNLLDLQGHRDRVHSLAFHPDGSMLASGANDNTIRLWDLERGVERLELRGHGNYVKGLAFSPDGETLASASGDNTVRLWTTLTMRERQARADAELAARAAVAPKVEALFASLSDARKVADAIRGDATMGDAERRAALHLVLKRGGTGGPK